MVKKLQLLHMVTLYNTYTRYTHAHYQEFIAVTFFARTGGNRNLAIIRPTQKISPVTVCFLHCSYTALLFYVLDIV